MAVPNNSSLSAEHRRHDRLLVARFAAGDVDGTAQQHEAQELVRRCSECAALAADIKAISTSVARMPAPSRMKDFRLTAQQADHLRGSRFDRFLRTLTGSSWTTVRPVAAVALSVGLVMSVVGAMPLLGAAGGAASPERASFTTPQPVSDAGSGAPHATQDIGPGPVSAPAVTPDQSEVGPGGQGYVIGPTTPAVDNIDNAYLTSKTDEPRKQGPGGVQEPQPSVAAGGDPTDVSTPLPGTSSGTNGLILIAGVLVSLLALIALAALYVARRRYYDPLLR
jgi:hypothetical protein